MEAPDFWDDPAVSQEKMKRLKSLKDDVETFEGLKELFEDIETMIEMGIEEKDATLVPEIAELFEEFEEVFEGIRMKTLLSGEYDRDNAILSLHAGAGRRCCFACIPDGRTRRAFPLRCWTRWTARRRESSQ